MVKFWFASLLVVMGHWLLDAGNRISVDAFEMNFDGTRPWGRTPDESL